MTPLVTGNGNYSTRISSTDTTFGAALVVAFKHPSLPLSTVVINTGMNELLPNPTEDQASTTFSDPHIGAGVSELSLFTFADDTFASNEKILFNGALVGGPIDANLAINPDELNSLFKLKVTTIAGVNTTTITSPDNGDQFGWPIAVLVSPLGAAVPEPASFVLLAVGILLLPTQRR